MSFSFQILTHDDIAWDEPGTKIKRAASATGRE
jgi:hypothetical protein